MCWAMRRCAQVRVACAAVAVRRAVVLYDRRMRPLKFDYERMTSQEFQGLVSALVVREFPQAQCMPLLGRDGGRDVIVQGECDGEFRDQIIFQVKMKEKSDIGVPTTRISTIGWLNISIGKRENRNP